MAEEFHPSLRFPFNGEFPVTFGFGAQPISEDLKQKYISWGLVGHNALDYGLPEENDVLAADDGKIIQAGENGDFGNSVTIQHGWGMSLYAHLKEVVVTLDQEVKRGDKLGLSGATGNITGPHLHFGIKPNNSDDSNGYLGFVDPTPYLSQEPKKEALPQPQIVEKVVEKIVEKEVVKEVPVEVIKEVVKEVPVEKIVEKEVVREVKVVNEEEVSKRVREELKIRMVGLSEKGVLERQKRRQDHKAKILGLAQEKGQVTNQEVQMFLHVSQSTATDYLSQLTREGKLRDEGKQRWVVYRAA